MLEQSDASRKSSTAEMELYVSLPFCIPTKPSHCGYCLFPVEDYKNSSQLINYLDYLKREGELYAPFHQDYDPISVYIGGGTPNLLKAEHYGPLMDIIRTNFPNMSADTPITLEGIPQLFFRGKIEALANHGYTRISMGAQQLNERLTKFSGRKQKPEHIFNAIKWAREFGLESNVDLIFGWPQQTKEIMLDDLNKLIDTGISHITHYELNIGGPTPFSLERRDELPGIEEVKELYHLSRELLLNNGYVQLTSYDFEKRESEPAGKFIYEECRRNYDHREVWGWGYAAISDFPSLNDEGGWTFMNHRNLKAYYDAIDRKAIPVESSFQRQQIDLKLALIFRNLQSLRVDRESYRRRFSQDVVDDFRNIWTGLQEFGLVEVDDDYIRLTNDGGYYVPLMQTLLSKERVEELVDRQYSRSQGLAVIQ